MTESPDTPMGETERDDGAEAPDVNGGMTSKLLRLGISGPTRPVDELIGRLEQPDGAEWLLRQFTEPGLGVLADPHGACDLPALKAAKESGKKLLGRPGSRDERLRGLLAYFLSIAAALHRFGSNISTRPLSDIEPVLADLATTVPEPWQSVLAHVSRPRPPKDSGER
ncbi:MAG: hypothetical protein ACOYN0_10545 [Phycisphaerales bacterium]